MTRIPTALPTKRRVWPLAGAVAFLVQIVAWAWMPPASAAAFAAVAGAPPFILTICSADGLKTVRLDGLPVGKPAAEPRHGCPLCPLVGVLGPAEPPAVAGPDSRPAERSAPCARSAAVANWFLSTLKARAPPLPV